MSRDNEPIANDILEIKMVGRLHGQTTMNVFHYLVLNAGTTPTFTLDDFIEAWSNHFWGALAPFPLYELLSDEFELPSITGQIVSPVRYVAHGFTPLETTGNVAAEACPSGTSVVVRRRGLEANRSNQGRVFIPALPKTHEFESQIAEGSRESWDNWAAEQTYTFTAFDGSVHDVAPVIFHPGGAGGSPRVRLSSVDYLLRYQRRREVGVGI